MLIKHSTFIACPIQEVWEETTDIDSWPYWAPTVQTARRLDKLSFGIGSQASIKQPMQSRKVWTVTEIEDGRYFVWETSGKAFRLQATHKVASQGSGTKCTLKVQLIGPVALISAVCLAPLIWLALMQENRGLKRWCETVRTAKPNPESHTLTRFSTAEQQISDSVKLNKG
ncbi:SRPBCC family protein [Loktanella sp. Alg231-35]|uniref:SRPBCC family protein n=1 Tax=Loktanella sp. Alg231-35 TaxID=1922220 RepID=UPI000D54C47E|nr:SRPBCC family protein [Loktanella sp. Alg231-35]